MAQFLMQNIIKMKKPIKTFFEDFIDKKSLFLDKTIIQTNYIPEVIPHRENQINQIANILAPSLKAQRPSNLFCYGKTGTGKTLTIRYTAKNMHEISKKRGIPLQIVYLNCKLKRIADTEYRLIAQIAREYGKEIPATGLPTDEVYKIFFNVIDTKKQIIILVLDEIDHLIRKIGDEIFYNLIRINEELKQAQISIVGISNDLFFANHLDPRVKSSLSEEEVVFPPYNAFEIQDILKERIKLAFRRSAVTNGVIEKCSAIAAREHGDARRAIELLRVAAEVADRENSLKITLGHIDKAEQKIENDKVVDVVSTHPKQHQAVLYAIINTVAKNKNIFTGDVYEIYRKLCDGIGLRPLTQRRVSDIIAEFDMLGIINAKIIYKGRYGRSREITLSIYGETLSGVKQILKSSLRL